MHDSHSLSNVGSFPADYLGLKKTVFIKCGFVLYFLRLYEFAD